jgi:hypothetical protein
MRVFDQPSTVGPACLLAALYALIAPYDETFAILLYLADVLIEQVRLQGPALDQGADLLLGERADIGSSYSYAWFWSDL